jgi:hypothetical protein
LTGLKDLVMGADADTGEIVATGDRASWFDGAGDDVVHRTEGDVPVEEVTEQFDDGPVWAVAN